MTISMQQRAHYYLSVLAGNGQFEGGLSFVTALRQSQLDYSVQSLDRIDYLLDRIRAQFKPQPGAFLKHAANQNFLYLLGFYVGSVVARESRCTIEWLEYRQLIRLVPDARNDLPQCFASSVACLLGNGAYFLPLAPIVERLFDATSGRSVRRSAESYRTHGMTEPLPE